MKDSHAVLLSGINLLVSMILTAIATNTGIGGNATAYTLLMLAMLVCMGGSFGFAQELSCSAVTMLFMSGLMGFATSLKLLSTLKKDHANKKTAALQRAQWATLVLLLLLRLYAVAPEQYRDYMDNGALENIKPYDLMPVRGDHGVYKHRYVLDLPTYEFDNMLEVINTATLVHKSERVKAIEDEQMRKREEKQSTSPPAIRGALRTK